jgi:hypothetical protein
MALDVMKPTTLPVRETWADATEDDDDGEEPPTVQADSLDLTALSIDDKTRDQPATGTQHHHSVHSRLTSGEDASPAKSPADPISSRSDEIEKEVEPSRSVEPSPLSTSTTASEAGGEKNEGEKKDDTPPETNLIQSKYEVAVKLQDMQADPSSPLYSVKSFEELGLYLPNKTAVNT